MHRNGGATALLQQLEKRFIARGCPQLRLLINKDHIELQSLYDQLGYEELDVICMSKAFFQE